ncbi:MAG: hypothetical protein COU28_03725 [Candidatus Magasanikbacteria bacterium CG10_big_fil_rev_8_21_14_0_10_36_16]|uniref:Uncharacterized protein n=1 Tax=Candidatus Magasanikbacteria bacterium CG10_big_fil_rev_8_21_14_0_10_36_16 TaxID=1974645 RepID=A0A2H0TXV7_9BACT|nr:MAG: hypothetical protein COU28_03725 [Candidatus Magasanikbacteria bacterium CG10_big_fil_rev_8_21_14_0_10_36_16]
MEIINQKINKDQFTSYVNSKDFGPKPPNKLVIHHTWSPTKEEWNGQNTINGREIMIMKFSLVKQ